MENYTIILHHIYSKITQKKDIKRLSIDKMLSRLNDQEDRVTGRS